MSAVVNEAGVGSRAGICGIAAVETGADAAAEGCGETAGLTATGTDFGFGRAPKSNSPTSLAIEIVPVIFLGRSGC
jgi:hypothetical protein